jgi:hypothetical protein
MPTVEESTRAWIDRLEVVDLIHRYSNAVTRRAWDEVEALFVPDAVWESPEFGLRFERAHDFVASLAEASTEVLIQTPHGPVVELVDGDHATATTTILELVRMGAALTSSPGVSGDPVNITHYGLYLDEVARVDGAWRFTHRQFRPIYVDGESVTGNPLPIPAEAIR